MTAQPTARVRRVVQIVGLRPEKQQEYLDLHRAVWPDVQQRLHDSHVTNYSIFLYDALLIAYFEYTGDDYDADMAAIAADEATKRWWRLTDPCQEPVAGATPGELWTQVPEIWRLAEPGT